MHIGVSISLRYNRRSVVVSLHSGDRLWTRSGPEGSSRSDWFGCCDQVSHHFLFNCYRLMAACGS